MLINNFNWFKNFWLENYLSSLSCDRKKNGLYKNLLNSKVNNNSCKNKS